MTHPSLTHTIPPQTVKSVTFHSDYRYGFFTVAYQTRLATWFAFHRNLVSRILNSCSWRLTHNSHLVTARASAVSD